MTDPKRHRRRFLRFSLRTFLVVLTLTGVWLGWQVNRADRQRKAVTWVEQMGGVVRYNYEVNEEGHYVDPKPTGPEWLRDYCHQVVAVDLGETLVSDLGPLAHLPRLEGLVLCRTRVSDLTPLANLKSLQSLSLAHTPVNDLTPLASLKGLQSLSISNTHVSDLGPLANLPRLETLYLGSTQVSSVTPLAGLKSLEVLSLLDTQVNDLTPLLKLKSLAFLTLEPTTSEEQIVQLRQALPTCEILHDDSP